MTTPSDAFQRAHDGIEGAAPAAPADPFALRPTEDENGRWDALDAKGYGHVLGYATADLAQAWIDGYDVGARENM